MECKAQATLFDSLLQGFKTPDTCDGRTKTCYSVVDADNCIPQLF